MEQLYKTVRAETVDDLRAEYHVTKLMEKVSPKFSVLPQPLDKTLVSIAPENTADLVAEQWKKKFMTVYNHQIMEKDEVDSETELKIVQKQHQEYN